MESKFRVNGEGESDKDRPLWVYWPDMSPCWPMTLNLKYVSVNAWWPKNQTRWRTDLKTSIEEIEEFFKRYEVVTKNSETLKKLKNSKNLNTFEEIRRFLTRRDLKNILKILKTRWKILKNKCRQDLKTNLKKSRRQLEEKLSTNKKWFLI